MATSSVSEEIARRIENIRSDRVHGASFLAREAIGVLVLDAVSAREERIHSLEEVGRRLAQAKPAMASIKNMVGRFIREMEVRGMGSDPRTLERELGGRDGVDVQGVGEEGGRVPARPRHRDHVQP